MKTALRVKTAFVGMGSARNQSQISRSGKLERIVENEVLCDVRHGAKMLQIESTTRTMPQKGKNQLFDVPDLVS